MFKVGQKVLAISGKRRNNYTGIVEEVLVKMYIIKFQESGTKEEIPKEKVWSWQ